MQLVNETETLLNVANYLEAGMPNDAPRIGHIGFNLDLPGNVSECGSVACIGGMAWIWENPDAKITDGGDYVYQVDAESRLGTLYYPSREEGFPLGKEWSSVTPKQASDAIRRYIYGEPKFWDHVQ